MDSVKDGKDAGASRKVKSWQEEEEEDGEEFTVFVIVRHWDLPYVTTHTNTSKFFTIYFNIILPPAVSLPSLPSGFSTKIFKEFLISRYVRPHQFLLGSLAWTLLHETPHL